MKRQFAANDRVSLVLDEDGIAHVRLTRPDKHNALDSAMIDALIEAGRVLFDMRELRCVVLAGDGPSFCAGIDLSGFSTAPDEDHVMLTDRTHGNANRFQQTAMQWYKLPVPVIAAVHGACFGGGLQVAGGADIRVTAPDARLSIMELKWGIVPDMGGFALWRGKVRDDVLRELTFTSREFSGEEATALGFSTFCDPDPVGRATEIAREIATRSPSAVREVKSLFNRYLDLSVDNILVEESIAQQKLFGTKNQIEAVASQFESRDPKFADP
ncbi:MAG: crotonase/enoyl-CoA hydratase family protein [Novosphingobium sp.]|nr:crotonase/enoyl-CoA hydratase family protein [Novosphingobium sp.]MCP5401537.1 crotonase/enoyl-CoA hydratase family protein [Novosphingobium sp.]